MYYYACTITCGLEHWNTWSQISGNLIQSFTCFPRLQLVFIQHIFFLEGQTLSLLLKVILKKKTEKKPQKKHKKKKKKKIRSSPTLTPTPDTKQSSRNWVTAPLGPTVTGLLILNGFYTLPHGSPSVRLWYASRKHTYIIMTPLNPTFI